MIDDDKLDAVFSALAHPARRAILARLAEGTATVNTLAEPFKMSLPAVSKHIQVLEAAGLIKREKDAQFRPCTLQPEALEAVASWTERYRPIWEARFDVMETLLNAKKDKQQ
jgi:DNA-binding transcriptional ArsR family regulator